MQLGQSIEKLGELREDCTGQLRHGTLESLADGIRPPLVSWGTLLQDASNIQTLAHFPWLLMPVVFIASAVLAFNFLGDGLRDATDPYSVV